MWVEIRGRHLGGAWFSERRKCLGLVRASFSLVARKMMIRRFAVCVILVLAAVDSRGARVGYFYALEADVAALREEAGGSGRMAKVGGTEVEFLQVGGHEVVAAEMGAGDVVAAVSVASVLAKYPCNLVISTGPVGALDAKAKLGGWFRVERVVAYQKGTEDSEGFSLARAATFAVDLPGDVKLSKMKRLVVASGEIFSTSDAFRDALRERTNADAIDMNLFGLVVACRSFDVPMMALRVVSDRAGDDAGAEFGRFSRDYDGEGGRRAVEVIRGLAAKPE